MLVDTASGNHVTDALCVAPPRICLQGKGRAKPVQLQTLFSNCIDIMVYWAAISDSVSEAGVTRTYTLQRDLPATGEASGLTPQQVDVTVADGKLGASVISAKGFY